MSSMLAAVRRVNLPGRVETSLRLRVLVLLSVEMAVLGTLVGDAAPAADGTFALVLIALGAEVSRHRAGKPNLGLKALLAMGAVVALARFFGDMRGVTTVEFARVPLASLFLAVQVLHGFDLPARRDLGFTMASSLTLVALAATSTHRGIFLVVLIAYTVVGALAMIEMQRSAALERSEKVAADNDLRLATVSLSSVGGGGRGGSASADGTDHGWPLLRDRTLRGMLRTATSLVLVGVLAFGLVPRGRAGSLAGL